MTTSPIHQDPSADSSVAKLDQTARGIYRWWRRVNWPLVGGTLAILIVLTLAILGPKIAPSDPMQESTITRSGDKWETPPFPILTPGYPLGSDYIGRDLLSRLLWAIQPTMNMVIIVAAVRLVLGTVIGLIAGWSRRWPGQVLDTAIAAALAVPVLMVALGGIAAVGVEYGILAFIIGLSITGWVETARIVRDQTQTIRRQVYIEAAEAMGASTFELLSRHVLRQIMPMIWMLLAFEISGVLLLTASLGFLGYYIGGDVWTSSISDSVARAISGAPELGQMLATTGGQIYEPWGMIALGGVVFLAVLGFNLLGEGLRQRLSLFSVGRRSKISEVFQSISVWIAQTITWPLGNLHRAITRSKAFRPVMLGISTLAVIGGVWWLVIANRPANFMQSALAFEGQNMWASARHDPYGTRWSEAVGPQEPTIAWTFEDPDGFSGGPAIASDGTVFAASNGGILYALRPDGSVRWQIALPAPAVGAPGLGINGEVYVADSQGGLSAFSAEWDSLWYFLPDNAKKTTAGPVVAPDGTIYYVLGANVQAISPDGEGLWNVQALQAGSSNSPLKIDPGGKFLFLDDIALNADDGSFALYGAFNDVREFVIGADGVSYLLVGNELTSWEENSSAIETLGSTTWDWRNFLTEAAAPKSAGVTPDQTIWFFYTSFARGWGMGEDTRVVWLTMQGKVLGNVHYGTRDSQVIAVDQRSTVYSCGNLERGYGPPECQAFIPDSEEPLWILPLEGNRVVGGALVPGRLYVSAEGGILYAIGEAEIPGEIVQNGEETAEPGGQEFNLLDLLPPAGSAIGPSTGYSVLFYQDEDGFSGSPTAGEDGTLYIASLGGFLYALDENANLIWKVETEAQPVGSAVLGKDGTLYLADREGGMNAYDLNGELLWRFLPDPARKAVATPAVGTDGRIYYAVQSSNTGGIQAVSPEGEGLWFTDVRTGSYIRTPVLSATGAYIFLKNEAFDIRDGAPLDFDIPFLFTLFFAGGDGYDYLATTDAIVRWQVTAEGFEILENVSWSIGSRGMTTGVGTVGVTEDGILWGSQGFNQVWMLFGGEVLAESQTEPIAQYGWARSVVAVDADLTLYVCGDYRFSRSDRYKMFCMAFSPHSEEPIWITEIEEVTEGYDNDILGGALVPGKLYVAREPGQLFVFGGLESQASGGYGKMMKLAWTPLWGVFLFAFAAKIKLAIRAKRQSTQIWFA